MQVRKHSLIKVVISVLAIIGLLVGCAGKDKTETLPIDSVDIAPVVAQAPEDPEPPDTTDGYFSADLKALRIKGNVAERSNVRNEAEIVYPEPVMSLEFDSVGTLQSSLMGLYPKVDADGFNYQYSMNESDGTSWIMTYTEFNEEGFPIRAEIEEDGPQGQALCKLEYYSYIYDRHGNWTIRAVGMERFFTDAETGEKSYLTAKWKENCAYTYR